MCLWKWSVQHPGNFKLSRSVSCLLNHQLYHLTARSEGIHLAVIKGKSWFLSVAIVKEDFIHRQLPLLTNGENVVLYCPPAADSGRPSADQPSQPDSLLLSSPRDDCEIHRAHRGGEKWFLLKTWWFLKSLVWSFKTGERRNVFCVYVCVIIRYISEDF